MEKQIRIFSFLTDCQKTLKDHRAHVPNEVKLWRLGSFGHFLWQGKESHCFIKIAWENLKWKKQTLGTVFWRKKWKSQNPGNPWQNYGRKQVPLVNDILQRVRVQKLLKPTESRTLKSALNEPQSILATSLIGKRIQIKARRNLVSQANHSITVAKSVVRVCKNERNNLKNLVKQH